MSDGRVSSNGGYHHDDIDPMTPPSATTIEDLAAALGALAEDTRNQYLVIGERLQALHDRGGAHEDASVRRHNAVLTAVQTQADASLAIADEVSAMGRHVQKLATKAELEALGAQLGRAQLESVAGDAKIAASVSRVRALAAVRVGALIGAGAALYKLFDLFYPLLHRG